MYSDDVEIRGEQLDRLSFNGGGRVFDIRRQSDGKFVIEEACDGYFSVTFTPYELKQLGEEIVKAAKE